MNILPAGSLDGGHEREQGPHQEINGTVADRGGGSNSDRDRGHHLWYVECHTWFSTVCLMWNGQRLRLVLYIGVFIHLRAYFDLSVHPPSLQMKCC